MSAVLPDLMRFALEQCTSRIRHGDYGRDLADAPARFGPRGRRRNCTDCAIGNARDGDEELQHDVESMLTRSASGIAQICSEASSRHPDDRAAFIAGACAGTRDAELHFTDGELGGLKLLGFAIWEHRGGGGRKVTFPARQYAVNGERRTYALLRPIADVDAQTRLRHRVLEAYADHEERSAIAS